MRSWPSPGAWRRRPADPGPAAATPPGCLLIGSGACAGAGVGPKAALLDRAAAAGLPVPSAVVVPDGLRATGIPRWCWSQGIVGVAVRSVFSTEDGDALSRAGWYHTRLRVPPHEVEEAVEAVRQHPSATAEDALRRDVLVMAMVEARHAGVAFSEAGTYDDLVNAVPGTAEALVGGQTAGQRHLVPRLERAAPGWPRRLQRLLRSVRRVFGDAGWDVEWADDGRVCWLLQVRAVTRPTRRNETLTIANHAEILPPLPSRLMASAVGSSGPGLFAWYRRFDPGLPGNRSFLELVAGRPFINLSLLEDLLRHLGLPTAMVAEAIGGPPEQVRPARPLHLARKAPVLLRMFAAQVEAVRRSAANEARLSRLGAEPAADFGEAAHRLIEAHVGLVTGMFPLSSAIGPPLSVLRRTGTLVEHAARHRSVTTELAVALDRARAAGPGTAPWQDFLDRFGHRGIYESDIARPRYRDRPDLIGTAPGTAAPPPSGPPPRTWRGIVTAPVWVAARGPLAARERLRDAAMVGFARLRADLVRLADTAVAAGQLPSSDHLWLLDIDEVRCLDTGWVPDDGFWTDRRAEIDRLAALDPPAVVRRFDDPSAWRPEPGPASPVAQGLSLTEGTVRGRAWVLREPSVDLPPGFAPADTVLVARSVDAGWIPTFGLAAAVVVETGGDLSHGSILLRELGKPAITNVRGITRAVTTGDRVEVRASAGVVERL